MRVELIRSLDHRCLKPARLPVTPHQQRNGLGSGGRTRKSGCCRSLRPQRSASARFRHTEAYGAEGGSRTHKRVAPHSVLSAARLPISPLRHGPALRGILSLDDPGAEAPGQELNLFLRALLATTTFCCPPPGVVASSPPSRWKTRPGGAAQTAPVSRLMTTWHRPRPASGDGSGSGTCTTRPPSYEPGELLLLYPASMRLWPCFRRRPPAGDHRQPRQASALITQEGRSYAPSTFAGRPCRESDGPVSNSRRATRRLGRRRLPQGSWWRRPGLHRRLGLMKPASVLLLHSASK